MRKFKHVKTGEEVTTCDSNSNFYQSKNIEVIPSRFIEDSSDWKEVAQKDYEILSYECLDEAGKPDEDDRQIFTKGRDGMFEWYKVVREENYFKNRPYKEGKSGYVVRSVKRSSDGEIFTVGDNISHVSTKQKGAILSIHHIGDAVFFSTTYCDSEKGTALKNAIKHKEPLYTTFDGIIRYEFQREYWVIQDKYIPEYDFKVCSNHLEGSLSDPNSYKIFSTEEKAREYLKEVEEDKLMNTPLLSLNDLLSVWKADKDFDVVKDSKLFKRFKEKACKNRK